jgi:hypothetical protein
VHSDMPFSACQSDETLVVFVASSSASLVLSIVDAKVFDRGIVLGSHPSEKSIRRSLFVSAPVEVMVIEMVSNVRLCKI